MGGAKTLSIIVAANIKGLETAMAKANKSVGNFASTAARIGSMMTFGVTAPILAMGKASMDTFVEFEAGMIRVQAVTQATTEEFALLNEEAKRLGATTAFTAQQFADLQLNLGRKGFGPTEIVGMTKAISELSLATGEDLSLSAKLASSQLRAFGKDVSQTTNVANTLYTATVQSDLTLSKLTTALGYASKPAKEFGFSLEETVAMLGGIVNQGQAASKAGRSLRSIFADLTKKGLTMNEALNSINDATNRDAEAIRLFGKNSYATAIILADTQDQVRKLTEEIQLNQDTLDIATEKMKNSAQYKILLMKSAIERTKGAFGEIITEGLLPFIKIITFISNKLTDTSDTFKKITSSVLGFLAIVGPLALIVGGLAALLPLLASGFAIMGGAIASAAVFLVEMLIPLGVALGALAMLGITAQVISDNFSAAWERISYYVGNALIEIAALIVEYNPFGILIDLANKAIDYFGGNPIPNIFEETADDIRKTKKVVDEFEHSFVSLGDSARNAFDNLIDFKNYVTGFDPMAEAIIGDVSVWQEHFNKVNDLIFEFTRGAVDGVAKITDKTISFGEAISQFSIKLSSQFADSFANLVVSGENLLQGLGNIFLDILKQMAQMIIKAAVLAAIFSMFGGGLGASGDITKFKDILKFSMGGMIPGRAKGGPVASNRPYMVGEVGPELFVPNQQGTIIPNNALGGGSAIPDVRISGNDLLIVFDRANRRQNRR